MHSSPVKRDQLGLGFLRAQLATDASVKA